MKNIVSIKNWRKVRADKELTDYFGELSFHSLIGEAKEVTDRLDSGLLNFDNSRKTEYLILELQKRLNKNDCFFSGELTTMVTRLHDRLRTTSLRL